MRWLIGGLLGLVGLAALVLGGAYFALKRPDVPYETLTTEYANQASQFIDLPGGIRMHFRDQGPSTPAPTLLLIHGFSASLHTWEPWVERLSGDYRIISLDLPGHGLTSAPAGYQASIEAFRDAVHAFVTARGIERFSIAGSSMGGNVAWQYALAHPEQVESLILVGASGWPDTRAEAQDEPTIFKLLRNPVLGPLMRDLDNTQLARQGLQASFYDPSLATDEMVQRYVRLARAPGHRDILLQITLGFRERNYATTERLAGITMPTLILHGDTDRLVPVEHGRQFHEAIAGSQFVEYAQTGHIPHEERAEESAMAVRQFLSTLFEGSALAAAPAAQNCGPTARCVGTEAPALP